ncbi:cellular tumor antigen p53 [Cephus cinctus]|uniref:Cellular tumor antigen p53 n=1 Tax=Cephus cinctus TaxID=211228 RepID=A0AAJ7FGD2_CEPCN|nr:cellular tumor antigen p53 [Cephus cinctus]
MTHNNILSDSQESALIDDATYQEVLDQSIDIEKLLGSDLLQEQEEKCNIHYEQIGPDVSYPILQVAPQTPQTYIPVKDSFAGPWNFKLLTNNQNSGKQWEYSVPLNKVFINMMLTLPLKFKWDIMEQGGMWLRTMMVFSLDQYQSHPVQRCPNHMSATDQSNKNVSPEMVKHVVRCLQSDCNYEETNGHFSVVAPLARPQAGADYVPVNFQFFCKNSCSSGMNRRPTELLFILEDSHGGVHGRQTLPVRICSCPRRDKIKEEAEVPGTRNYVAVSGGKKRKISIPQGKKLAIPLTTVNSSNTDVYSLSFNVVGKENSKLVLKYAYDIMAGDVSRNESLHDSYKPYMDALLQKKP